MKHLIKLTGIFMVLLVATTGILAQQPSEKSSFYLVEGTNGPGFTSPQEAIMVLEKGILPTFAAIKKLQKDGKIVAGGLPVGDRAMVFVVKAKSNKEVDKLLRNLPAWAALQWKVTALQSFSARAAHERKILGELKKMSTK